MSKAKEVEAATKETDSSVIRILRYFLAFSYLMSAPQELIQDANNLLEDLENEA